LLATLVVLCVALPVLRGEPEPGPRHAARRRTTSAADGSEPTPAASSPAPGGARAPRVLTRLPPGGWATAASAVRLEFRLAEWLV